MLRWLGLLSLVHSCAAFSRPNFQLQSRLTGDPLEKTAEQGQRQFNPNDTPMVLPREQWPEWKHAHPRLCSLPFLCMDKDFIAIKVSTMATADLWVDMLGVGSPWFVLLVLPCAVWGLWDLLRKPHAGSEQPPEAFVQIPVAQGREFTDRFIDWWTCGPRVTQASLKAFVTALLLIELLGLTAPETNVFAFPETLRRVRAHPFGSSPEQSFLHGWTAGDAGLTPRLTYLVMPGLNNATADGYAAAFAVLRTSLLVCWCAFLAFPCTLLACRVCFVWGAVVYVVMASFSLMYEPTYDCHSTCFFLVAACLVPSLETSGRCQSWLGMFLLFSNLAPYYLSAGLAKIRYGGCGTIFSGSWLKPVMVTMEDRSLFPGFNNWLSECPWMLALMSYGVVLVEFLLPILVLFLASSTSYFTRWLQTSWILLTTFFHVGNAVLVAATFARQMALLMVALHAVWIPASEPIEPWQKRSFRGRVGFAAVLLMLWICNQVWSDIDHIRGATPWYSHHDMFWPIGELSMFMEPSASSNYVFPLFLEIVIVIALSLKLTYDILPREAKA